MDNVTKGECISVRILKKIGYWAALLIVMSIAGVVGKGFSKEVVMPFIFGETAQQNEISTTSKSTNPRLEIKGFRELHFGDRLETVIKHYQVEYQMDHTWPSGITGTYYYVMCGDEDGDGIFGIPVNWPLSVVFIDNRLCFIYAYFENTPENFRELKTGFTSIYGEPFALKTNDVSREYLDDLEKTVGGTPSFDNVFVWDGGKGAIELCTSSMNGVDIIILSFLSKKDAAKAFSGI